MQAPMIEALCHPDCYPHTVDAVDLVETHISWVLLAGDTVYKIKKPLDLGFLDFSTLEKRRFFCEEEVRLNQRTAPDLYLDVVPIRGTPEKPSPGGPGEILDYAVRMRRFDADAGFDHLLEQQRLTRQHVIDLARQLAGLHHIAGIAGPGSDYGNFHSVTQPVRDNFTDLAKSLHDRPIADGLDALQDWTEAQLVQLAPLIEARQRDGFIRECHGDAHLGNVALIDGRATLFDCVEFSSDLRWIDLMSDLAFAVMDLHSRGEPRLAWLLLDEYLATTGDYAGVRLLPLYLVHRALVRAKVTALRLEDPHADRDTLLGEVAKYLSLASRISSEHRPAIVITVGLSGSGKSWLAGQLVEHAGLVRVRSDVERKRLHGLDPQERSDSGIDADLYSAQATERTYRHIARAARALVDAGMPALIDAACLKRWQRDRFRELAAQLAVPFGILQCHADEPLLRRRLLAREATGSDPSDAGLAVLAHQLQTLEPLAKCEEGATRRFDTASDCVDEAADWIRTLTAFDGVGHVTTAG